MRLLIAAHGGMMKETHAIAMYAQMIPFHVAMGTRRSRGGPTTLHAAQVSLARAAISAMVREGKGKRDGLYICTISRSQTGTRTVLDEVLASGCEITRDVITAAAEKAGVKYNSVVAALRRRKAGVR